MSEQEQEYRKKLDKAAKTIISAGMIPFPLTDTLLEILSFYLDAEDLELIQVFKSSISLAEEDLIRKSKLPPEEAIRRAQKLAKKGFIFNQPSSKGVMVYRLLPLVITGTFEYTYMQKLPTEAEEIARLKKLAKLYEKLLEDLRDRIQQGYDQMMPMFEKAPPTDRTIPIYHSVDGQKIEIAVNQEISAQEQILPTKTVEEIINKFDDIAVGNCFCRQYREMLENPCKIHAPMETCFTFGKSARHTVQQGFARKITKEEAVKILKATEDAGLVHKIFHNGSDIFKEENSICNCCKDCCDGFQLWRMGALPMINSTNYMSHVKEDTCIGCGTCIEKCPMDAIALNSEGKAFVDEKLCIGCGVCAHFCPENAILLREGLRTVFILPPKLG